MTSLARRPRSPGGTQTMTATGRATQVSARHTGSLSSSLSLPLSFNHHSQLFQLCCCFCCCCCCCCTLPPSQTEKHVQTQPKTDTCHDGAVMPGVDTIILDICTSRVIQRARVIIRAACERSFKMTYSSRQIFLQSAKDTVNVCVCVWVAVPYNLSNTSTIAFASMLDG